MKGLDAKVSSGASFLPVIIDSGRFSLCNQLPTATPVRWLRTVTIIRKASASCARFVQAAADGHQPGDGAVPFLAALREDAGQHQPPGEVP